MPVQTDPTTVTVFGRLSFPEVFKPKQGTNGKGEPTGEPKYSLVLLLDKKAQAADIALLTEVACKVKKDKWQDKPVNLARKSIRDGSEKEATDGYGAGVVFISASNKRRPSVVGRKLEPIVEEDGRIYAGCYVNVEVNCWAQDNGHGKAINWSLQKVQFVKDGEPFGAKQTPVESAFKALPDDDSAVDQPAGASSDI